jgi:hypothetical protein
MKITYPVMINCNIHTSILLDSTDRGDKMMSYEEVFAKGGGA